MGYDVTFHPFNRKEFSFFIEKALDHPESIDQQLAAIHDDEGERKFIQEELYNNFIGLKTKVAAGAVAFDGSIGFGISAILGFLHPYWYSRNGMITLLMDQEPFKQFPGKLASLVSEENKAVFDKAVGFIEGAYSSGCYIPFENIDALLKAIVDPAYKEIVSEALKDQSNIDALKNCLKYCLENQLDLLEATDLYVPFTGETSTYPANIRMDHLKNIDDFSNQSRKQQWNDSTNTFESRKIDQSWWDSLSDPWKNTLRQRIKKEKLFFNPDKSPEWDKLATIKHIPVYDRKEQGRFNTIAPLFYFPQLQRVSFYQNLPRPVDLSLIADIKTLEGVKIKASVVHFDALANLPNLSILELEESNLKTKDLKIINTFPSLKVLKVISLGLRSAKVFEGNKTIEQFSSRYSKGINDLPNLKYLVLYLRDAIAINNCPKLELVEITNARKMTNLEGLQNIPSMKELIIRNPYKKIDLSLLPEITNLEIFHIDQEMDLSTISKPIPNIKLIKTLKDDPAEDHFDITTVKQLFPNAKFEKYINPYQAFIKVI